MNHLAKRAMLANLTINCWEARVFDRTVTQEVIDSKDAKDGTALVTKRLLPKEALAKINKIVNEARTYHTHKTAPWFDKTRMLPNEFFTDYSKKMKDLRDRFLTAVSEFDTTYPDWLDQAPSMLGKMYNAGDYPAPGEVRARFNFNITFIPVPDKTDFRVDGISEDDLAEIKNELEARMTAQLTEAVQHAAQRINVVVGNLANRLKVYKPADAKSKTKAAGKFHDSLIEHVKELAEALPALNLNDDPELAAITKRIVEQLSVHKAEDLRGDSKLRKLVAKDAGDILKTVKKFLA